MIQNVALLFDLDGVLIDSEREYTKIWETIDMTFPTGIHNFANSIKGETLTKILGDNYPNPEVRIEVERMLHNLEREMTYKFCEGTEQFLQSMIDSKVYRAVVTSSDSIKMSHLYRDIKSFKTMFPLVVDASLVKKSKPDPEGYLLAAQKLHCNIRNCAVFEDSVQGVKAGKASGAYVVGIIGTKTLEELQPYCDIMVDRLDKLNLHDLLNILSER